MWPYWYRHWTRQLNDMNDMERFVHQIFASNEVTNRLETESNFTATIRKGDKVYRVKVEEVIPTKEELSIEFDADKPPRHPDYTE